MKCQNCNNETEMYQGVPNPLCRNCYSIKKNGKSYSAPQHRETIKELSTPSRNEIQEHIDKTSIFKSLCSMAKKGSKAVDIARETDDVYKLLFL